MTPVATVDAQNPITTPHQLRAHLHQAAQVELSTIPLYLYAAYSIKTQSYYQWNPGVSAFRTIRSVVIEEMLHLCLARNLLIAIGGADDIKFFDKDFIPKYPSPMLHHVPELILRLDRCSPELMKDVFLPLELPEAADAPPEPRRYHTLGQFYEAIRLGFERLNGEELWLHNRPDLQYGFASSYWNEDGGGHPIIVTDLDTAKLAMKTIVEQGEGSAPGHSHVQIDLIDKPVPGQTEFSHYAKFRRIARGIDEIGEVWPVPVNPTVHAIDEITGDTRSPVSRLVRFFNASYCYVLAMIDALYAASSSTIAPGQKSERYAIERKFLAAMGGILYPVAALLVTQPLGDGTNAAPTFEWYEFPAGRGKQEHLAHLCDELLGDYPILGGDNGVRNLISGLPAL
jgi:hypothetical protein